MPTVKILSKVSDKGYPFNNKRYKSAHEAADKAEKKADPKAYKAINKMDRKLKGNTAAGKHTKNGTIEIQKNYTKPHYNVSGKRIKRNLIKHEIVETKKEKPRKK